MRIVIVGSGTLQPVPGRTSPAHFVEGSGFNLLWDCGAETVGSMARLGLPWTELTHVALTHFHTDHVGGLPALFWALKHGAGGPSDQPLTLLGPPGLAAVIDRLAQALGQFIRAPGRVLSLVELDREDRWSAPGADLELATFPAEHTERSVSYRLETALGPVAYSGDTGPHAGLARAIGRTRVTISECAQPDESDDPNHLRPVDLAHALRGVEPELLVTTHAYPPLIPEDVPDLLRSQGYTGAVTAGRDGLAVRVETGQVLVEHDPPGPHLGEHGC